MKASSVTGSTQPFRVETAGPAPLAGQSFPLTIGEEKTFEGLLPGTYTITELTDAAHLPAPWRLESLDCTGLTTGASVAIDGAQATLTFAPANPGSVITCTYTNEQMNLFVDKSDAGVTAVAGGARRLHDHGRQPRYGRDVRADHRDRHAHDGSGLRRFADGARRRELRPAE